MGATSSQLVQSPSENDSFRTKGLGVQQTTVNFLAFRQSNTLRSGILRNISMELLIRLRYIGSTARMASDHEFTLENFPLFFTFVHTQQLLQIA